MSAKKTTDSEPTTKKHSGFTKAVVWLLMGLLVVGLGGFGVSNFGGTLGSIGSVGDEEISVNEYALALQQEIRVLSQQTGQNLSLSQADALSGVVFGASASDRVLGRLIATGALDAEAGQIGLSMGDARIQNEVLRTSAFQGLDGQFDREAYTYALERAGITERDYEDSLRKENARTMLQSAVVNGIASPSEATETLLGYAAERRNFTMIRLGPDDLETSVPDPDDTQIEAYYDANPAEFTAPEKKRITYALLTPDMIIDTIAVDEDALRALYDERIDAYRRPERRLIERLVFEDDAAALDAHTRLENGEISYDKLVSERGLTLTDVDLGDLAHNDLGDAADAIFALAEPGDYTPPQPSALGPAIFRMNGILHAQETTFEEARADLLAEFALDRARRVVADSASEIDDLLAGGATLEELAGETEMVLGQIDWHANADDPIAGYEGFRAAAAAISEDDFPEVAELEDGGIFALRLDETIAPALEPLDDVRDAVIEAWRRDETDTRILARAEALTNELDAGASPGDLGLEEQVETEFTRDAFVEGTPPDFNRAVFGMEPGARQVIGGPALALIVRMDEVLPPDLSDPDIQTLETELNSNIAEALGQDLFSAYAHQLQMQAGISLDQRAISAVQAQFP